MDADVNIRTDMASPSTSTSSFLGMTLLDLHLHMLMMKQDEMVIWEGDDPQYAAYFTYKFVSSLAFAFGPTGKELLFTVFDADAARQVAEVMSDAYR